MPAVEQSQNLHDQLLPVYDEIVKRYPLSDAARSAWREGFCVPWSRLAKPHAARVLGPQAVIRHVTCWPIYEEPVGTPGRAYFHEYLLDTTAPEDPTIIDGTWQQFAPPETQDDANTPRILIVRASEAPDVLARYGVQQDLLCQWQPGASFEHLEFKITA